MKLSEITKILNLNFTEKDIEISALNSLRKATKFELSYCDGIKNEQDLKDSKAGVILVSSELKNSAPSTAISLVCDNPHLAFATLSKFFAKPLLMEPKLYSTIDPSSKIMPSAYIGSNVKIGKNSTIMPGAYIGDNVNIGDECIIYPNVVIYNDTMIQNRCVIHANSVIGSDGFGYAHTKTGKHVKIYHNGNVILEDDVEIGACTTIDRGVFEPTIIRKGTKIDNLVQIGHNCVVGENCIIVSQTGLAGSTILGRNVVMGGQSGSSGHVSVGDFAQIAARGGIGKNLKGGKAYAGYPIHELKEWLKLQVKITKFFKDKK